MLKSTVQRLKPLYKDVGDKASCPLCGAPYDRTLYVPNMERVSGFGVHGLMKAFHLCFSCYESNVRRRLKTDEPTRGSS